MENAFRYLIPRQHWHTNQETFGLGYWKKRWAYPDFRAVLENPALIRTGDLRRVKATSFLAPVRISRIGVTS